MGKLRILRYEDRGLGLCAVFEEDWMDLRTGGMYTFALVENSLRMRIKNLKKECDADTSTEEQALAYLESQKKGS